MINSENINRSRVENAIARAQKYIAKRTETTESKQQAQQAIENAQKLAALLDDSELLQEANGLQ